MKRRLACSLKVRLYCSPVTKELLLTNPRYKFWENHIVALEVETPTQISLVDEASGESRRLEGHLKAVRQCVQWIINLEMARFGLRKSCGHIHDLDIVTATSQLQSHVSQYDWVDITHEATSSHCGKVASTLKTIPVLSSRVKDIQSLYLDTTFCDPKYYQIPSRVSKTKGITSCSFCCLIVNQKVPAWNFWQPYLGFCLKDQTGQSSYRACFSFHSSYSEIQDFVSYICPVNVYPNVIPVGATEDKVREILKPLCRMYSQNNKPMYKPLGALKRARTLDLADAGGDGDDLFDTELNSIRYKIPKLLPEITPSENKPLPQNHEDNYKASSMPTSLKVDFVECEESNGEDDDEEEESEKEMFFAQDLPPSADTTALLSNPDGLAHSDTTSKQNEDMQPSLEMPKWDMFFQHNKEDTDTSELEDNFLPPTGSTEPHSPSLLSDSDSTHISSQNSSQSTHISEQGSQGWDSQGDTVLISSQERRNF
ncbi:hypothetical protein JD844_027502 [Phrynosoma platyrhinos]|uniref:Protein artemis n=1 Tax=Phrynosoma platyrhinos TaxID=52577 RepID=A0ABQ7SGF0_PHRPL|nr:hypothetical protein JD844_027502 [Phrynosoma platyrhinos]